nr:TPA_asm: hypothetical protein HUJ06_006845 [Nelumbo nucifera]
MNYLRPDIKRGNISPEEEDLIIRLHSLLGNRWSLIAGRLPGRTDNEIKNYWNTHLSKRFKSQGTDSNAKTKAAKRSTGEPKKRKSNNQQKKKKSIGRGNNDQETTKTKIHLPKPVRITSLPISRNNSFEYNTPLSLQGGEKGVVVYTEDLELPWPYLRDGATTLIEGDQDHNLVVGGCDLGCQSQIPVKDNGMLEKLYEEYLQLINTDTEEDHQAELDSFAESLWA